MNKKLIIGLILGLGVIGFLLWRFWLAGGALANDEWQEEPYCEVEEWSCAECQVVPQEDVCGEPKYDFCQENYGCEFQYVYNENGEWNGEYEWVCEDTCQEEPRDVCSNLEGIQEEVPQGYHQNDGECLLDEPELTPPPEIPTEIVQLELTSAGAPQGPTCLVPTWAPTVTDVGRIDSDTIFARWTEVAEWVNHYVIWYGVTQNNLSWNTIVEGEYVELNEVPNTHIWLKVAGYDNGCTGPFSIVTDP